MKSKIGIIIDEKHREKIAEALAAVNGQARKRTISVDDVLETVEKIKEHLGLSPYTLSDCTFHIDLYAQIYAAAYHYPMLSTQFDVIFKNGKAYLTDVDRTLVKASDTITIWSTLTRKAKVALLDRYERIA